MTGRHWLVAFSLITGSGVLQVRAGCVADENCQQVLSVSGSSGYCRYEAHQLYCGYRYPYCDVSFSECDDGSTFSWSTYCQCY